MPVLTEIAAANGSNGFVGLDLLVQYTSPGAERKVMSRYPRRD